MKSTAVMTSVGIDIIDIWNSLSEFIVSAPSTNTFKKRIDNNWKKIWATYKRLTSSLANAHYL